MNIVEAFSRCLIFHFHHMKRFRYLFMESCCRLYFPPLLAKECHSPWVLAKIAGQTSFCTSIPLFLTNDSYYNPVESASYILMLMDIESTRELFGG